MRLESIARFAKCCVRKIDDHGSPRGVRTSNFRVQNHGSATDFSLYAGPIV